ncbi:hypothetical protein GOBAR_AA39266 [Gossypium barbadense]|uniref:Uncharacterized protein n=5 Tax=Gossypium TaxID=3633 RepID=A0ABR0MQZ8_GOSAR|nr:uncharacterized protein LOC108478770 [Gossypium arboreum]KAK5776365.1 hypothetical protein PVK06_044324 [Gossypium arboreum]PPR81447.1 hypothetical protein GOBAR_AA39266 [Gossypium barbadense]TYG89984.1 hypothetical protein ES288_A12G146600v1 [Gossypium darwinii]TYH96000.1 hypothetical protein ES332_A12G147400v1 [Gossypium tomentosum]
MKLTKMPKKNGTDLGRRAWSFLRLALLWARKGGVFKRRLTMVDFRLVIPKFLKSSTAAPRHDRLHYKEREFSFDETPIFHVKVHRSASMRFLLPCISPTEAVDFEDHEIYSCGNSKNSYSTCSDIVEEGEEMGYEGCDEKSPYPLEEEGIDLKAEKFIAKFYEQIKLQRQISDLEYTEMIKRGAS